MSTELRVECTASFVHVFEPRAVQQGGEKKYSVQLVFDRGYNYDAIIAAINEAAAAKWGNNLPPGLRYPLVDPQTKPKLKEKEFYQGKWYISANSKDPIPVFDQWNNRVHDKSKLFSGCRIEAFVNFSAYENVSMGVGAYVNGIRIVDNSDKVERLDNQKSVTEMFGAPLREGSDPNAAPTGMPSPNAGQGQTTNPQPGPGPDVAPNSGGMPNPNG